MATLLGGTAGVIGQFNDPQYLNWIKSTRMVYITMEALKPFSKAVMNELHQLLLNKYGRTLCSGSCSSGDIFTNNSGIKCPNNVCSQWLAGIMAEGTKPTTRLTFGNCCISRWPVEPWQVAKAFMNSGQNPSSDSPDDTDASGILQLLINCHYFTFFLNTWKADKVRNVRNDVTHTSTMKVTTAQLSTYVKTMIDLLKNIHYPSDYPVEHRVALQAAQQVARQGSRQITQIQTTPINVTDAAFLAQERQAWQQALSDADVQCKHDILKLIASNSALEGRLQAEIAEVKMSLKAHDTQLKDQGIQLKDLDTKLQDMQTVQIQALNTQLEDHDARLEAQRQQMQDMQTGPTINVCFNTTGSSEGAQEVETRMSMAIYIVKEKQIQDIEALLVKKGLSRKEIEPILRIMKYCRIITNIKPGSIILSVMCPTLEALDDLYKLCTSGQLTRMFTRAYITDEYRHQNVAISVTIDETKWQQCRIQLLSTDMPSPPRNLQVVEEGKDYICVTWQAPKSDGNSPITRYVVEKVDASGSTASAGHTNVDTLQLRVSLLVQDKHYMVRVFAENAVGRSEPVWLPVSVSLPFGKWKRKRGNPWNEKLQKLLTLCGEHPDELVRGIRGQICMCTKEDYMVAKGCSGTAVYLGFTTTDGREVAVKRSVKHDDKRLNKRVDKEVKALIGLSHHPNIVEYMMPVLHDMNFSYIALELCDYSLETWFKQKEVKDLTEEDWRMKSVHLIGDLLCGLEHIHANGMVHRDLKPRNLFIVQLASGSQCLKIGDFGLTRSLENGASTVHTAVDGTKHWLPKEVIVQMNESTTSDESSDTERKIEYKQSGDIQVCGMLCYYIVTQGGHPYRPLDDELHTRVKNGKPDLSPVKLDFEACDLISSMLADDPKARPSAEQLRRHLYFWSDRDRYEFIVGVAKEDEVHNSHKEPHKSSEFVRKLEDTKICVFPNGEDWEGLSIVPANVSIYRQLYSTDSTKSVCKLICAMRNIQEHYVDQPEEVRDELGVKDEEGVHTFNYSKAFSYFHTNFQRLVWETYRVVKEDKSEKKKKLLSDFPRAGDNTKDGPTKTCSILTNHFTAYALVIQKAVKTIMLPAVAAIVTAMLLDAWLDGTTEIVAMSAAAVGLVALTYSVLWSGATRAAATYKSSLGSPPADCAWINQQSRKWHTKLTKLKESENKLVCEKENLIATGSSGTSVYIGFYSRLEKTVEEVAVKVVPTDGNKAKACRERKNEADILLMINHINIVAFYTADSVMYMYELCDYTLDDWITEKKHEPEWSSMARDLIQGLLTALDHLHWNEILHCDLTPENILVHASGQLKLGDFGISRTFGDNPIVDASTGTPLWKAKEVLQLWGCYDTASEIYVAGMVAFYVMSGGTHPFHAASEEDVEKKIACGNPHLSAVQDQVAVDMVKTMLADDPVDRPSAPSLLSHPYLWSDSDRYKFIATVADEKEVENSLVRPHKDSDFVKELNETKIRVFPNKENWEELSIVKPIRQAKIELSKQYTKQRTNKVCTLIRVMRNILHHHAKEDLPPGVIDELGGYPFSDSKAFFYFNTNFPHLLLETYKVVKKFKADLLSDFLKAKEQA